MKTITIDKLIDFLKARRDEKDQRAKKEAENGYYSVAMMIDAYVQAIDEILPELEARRCVEIQIMMKDTGKYEILDISEHIPPESGYYLTEQTDGTIMDVFYNSETKNWFGVSNDEIVGWTYLPKLINPKDGAQPINKNNAV